MASSVVGIVGLFVVFQLNLIYYSNRKQLRHKTVIIFGASLGLGKSLALEFSKSKPKSLILVARGSITKSGKSSLEELKSELSVLCENVIVEKLDVCDVKAVKAFFQKYRELNIDWVVINAGICLPSLIKVQNLDFDNNLEETQIKINYYGSLNIVKSIVALQILPERLVFVSSLVCAGSFAGYGGYSASKYALKGFTDSIRNEFQCYNSINKMKVHLYLPGSIDSPGYENENLLKPEVTKSIEGTVDLISSQKAANILINGVLRDFYLIPSDFVGLLAIISINGLKPRKYVFLETLALPAICIATHLVSKSFDKISSSN